MNLVAKLPWWGGLLLAVVGWFIFHRLAGMKPDTTGLGQGRTVKVLFAAMVPGLGYALQYVFPLLCVCAAGVSWYRRRTRAQLVERTTRSTAADALNGMGWREFELLVGEAFRMQGYSVAETGGGGADGGVDLALRRGSETFLVQCKQWKAYKVGVDVVRELYGVMAARGAAGGFVVTSGTFTSDAREFAQGRNVKLIEGPLLMGLLQRARTSFAAKDGPAATAPQPPTSAVSATADAPPQCPACSAPMLRRTARKGGNAGLQFWGCSRFPACRGTR